MDARIIGGGDGLSPIAEEDEEEEKETEEKDQEKGSGNNQPSQENEEDIYQGDFHEDEDGGVKDVQTIAPVDQLGAKENAVVDVKITPIPTEATAKPTEGPTQRFNDSSNNSTTQRNSETNSDVKAKPGTAKRTLKAGRGSNLPPLVAPRPPTKPKEKSSAADTATTKTDKAEGTSVTGFNG